MRNLEFPVQQAAFEDMQALYVARFAAVEERLHDPDRAITAFLVDEMKDIPLRSVLADGMTLERKPTDMTLERVSDELYELEWDSDPDQSLEEVLNPERSDLRVIGLIDGKYKGVKTEDKVLWLCVAGLVAGQNKPLPNRIDQVMNREGNLTLEEETFKKAYQFLKSKRLHPGEQEAIGRSRTKLEKQIDSGNEKAVRKAIDTLDKYWLSDYAGKVIDRLLSDKTSARDTRDELQFNSGFVKEMTPVPDTDQPAQIVTLPWPLLPKGGDGQPHPESKPTEIGSETERASTGRREQVEHPYLTKWIGSLAASWEFGGVEVRVELPSGDQEKEYKGALLNGPDGTPFMLVADTAKPDNALYYGVAGELHDPETGQAVSLLEAFEGNKTRARRFGAERVEHRGQEFHSTMMDIIITKALERM
ncbi:MAG: hypothetical protein ABWX94_02480 [Candidatus Saccharimonadales bacterium]